MHRKKAGPQGGPCLNVVTQRRILPSLIIAAPASLTCHRDQSKMLASRRMVIRVLCGGAGTTAPRGPLFLPPKNRNHYQDSAETDQFQD
jgi:hypothetical protein